MTRLAVAGAVVVLLAAATAGALAADSDTLDPDRPDVSSGPKTVGAGRVQLESGVLFTRTRLGGEPTERRLSAESLLRVGVGERLELRFEGDPIVRLRGAGDATDVGDFRLRAKWRFLVSASLSRKLAAAVTGFGEIFYASRGEWAGRDDVGVDAGIVWTLLPNLALDAAVGTSLYGRVPDVFVRAGGSVRFGR